MLATLVYPWCHRPSSAIQNAGISPQPNSYVAPPRQQLFTTADGSPRSNVKRKRGDSTPESPGLASPSQKPRTEGVSHVEAPSPNPSNPISTLPTPQSKIENASEVSQSMTPEELGSEGAYDGYPTLGKCDTTPHLLPDSRQAPQISATGRSSVRVQPSRQALYETVEAQFNLEILLKHKELLLIDQEFAKCQAALEQLRRCQIIPYPALSDELGDIQAGVEGTGMPFDNQALHAPPWGVTDGPYTRHYQRWLLPDPAFDDSLSEVQTPRSRNSSYLPERSTRGCNGADSSSAVGTSRSQRGSNNSRLEALSPGYPEQKKVSGPMIVRRSSDGKMVKLVCLDCRRSNFNSTQGFINHCRIQHSRQFLSHDAAIEASGEEIDETSELGLAELNTATTVSSAGLVHPLIRSALSLRNPTTPAETPSSLSRQRRSQMSNGSTNLLQTNSEPQPTMAAPQPATPATQHNITSNSSPFTPSPQTPHLSAFLQRVNFGGNLEDMVTEARTIPEPDPSTSSDEEENEEAEQEPSDEPQSRSTRGIIRGGDLPSQVIRDFAEKPSANPTPIKPPFHRSARIPNILQPPPQKNPHPLASPSSTTPSELDDPLSHHENHQNTDNLSPKTAESHGPPSLIMDDEGESERPDESEAESTNFDDDGVSKGFRQPEFVDENDQQIIFQGEGGSSDWYHHNEKADHANHHHPHPAHNHRMEEGRPENRRVTFVAPAPATAVATAPPRMPTSSMPTSIPTSTPSTAPPTPLSKNKRNKVERSQHQKAGAVSQWKHGP